MIELLIALLILSFTLSVGAITLKETVVSTAQARRLTDAVNVGQRRLEALQSVAYASLVGGTETITGMASAADATAYVVTWTVAAGPLANTRAVVVTVNWSDRLNASHAVRLSSLVSNLP